MADYRLSGRAAGDLESIAEYTIQRFGIDQARLCRDELKHCFEQLADNPMMGRPAKHLGLGVRRHEHRSHIIFYKAIDTGVLIIRLLHHRMDIRLY